MSDPRKPDSAEPTTHFGYQNVPESQKAKKVAEVFHSVAAKYDLMNDVLSGGLHRLWKRFTIELSGVRPGNRVLDIAGGTGDLTRQFSRLLESLAHGGGLPDVGRRPAHLAVMAQLGAGGLQAGLAATHQGDVQALGQQLLRNGETYAPGSAGNQGMAFAVGAHLTSCSA